jgi:hypothetical protein
MGLDIIDWVSGGKIAFKILIDSLALLQNFIVHFAQHLLARPSLMKKPKQICPPE